MGMMHSLCRTLLRCSPLLVIACASVVPAPAPPPSTFELLRCQPTRTALAQVDVDEAGDIVAVRGHRLVLPPRAVSRRTTFIVRDRETEHVGVDVDVQPRGTRFNVPAELTLSYARCATLPPGFAPAVVQVTHGGTQIVGRPLTGVVDANARTITVRVDHFSGYLIGSNRSE